MNVEDYYPQGKRWWLRLHEKGGGLSIGRIYDSAGRLVASATQECLLAPVVP